MHLPFPSSDTLMGLQNQGRLLNLSGVLYSYIFNRFMFFCIPTYSSTLCCSVFLYIQSFYVALYFYIFKRFIYSSVFLHIQSFYVLYFYIIYRFMISVSTYSIALRCLYFYILLCISTYLIVLCCSIFLHMFCIPIS